MTTPEAILEMLTAWNKIMLTAEDTFPGATQEELYQISKGAMSHALGCEITEPKGQTP